MSWLANAEQRRRWSTVRPWKYFNQIYSADGTYSSYKLDKNCILKISFFSDSNKCINLNNFVNTRQLLNQNVYIFEIYLDKIKKKSHIWTNIIYCIWIPYYSLWVWGCVVGKDIENLSGTYAEIIQKNEFDFESAQSAVFALAIRH